MNLKMVDSMDMAELKELQKAIDIRMEEIEAARKIFNKDIKIGLVNLGEGFMRILGEDAALSIKIKDSGDKLFDCHLAYPGGFDNFTANANEIIGVVDDNELTDIEHF